LLFSTKARSGPNKRLSFGSSVFEFTGLFSLLIIVSKVSISNIIGTQVFENEVEASNGSLSKELHVNYLSNGIYFVKINSGKKEHIKKIVINN